MQYYRYHHPVRRCRPQGPQANQEIEFTNVHFECEDVHFDDSIFSVAAIGKEWLAPFEHKSVQFISNDVTNTLWQWL